MDNKRAHLQSLYEAELKAYKGVILAKDNSIANL